MRTTSLSLKLALLLCAATAGRVFAQGAEPWYWRVEPSRRIAYSDSLLRLCPNNAWAACMSRHDANAGRVHLVYTADTGKPDVWYRLSDDTGKTWQGEMGGHFPDF